MDSESTTRDHPDFAPMVVGHTESHRARVASAHDDTRKEPAPGLHQDAQNVLANLQHVCIAGTLGRDEDATELTN